jgi:hypothetical protein
MLEPARDLVTRWIIFRVDVVTFHGPPKEFLEPFAVWMPFPSYVPLPATGFVYRPKAL